MLAQEEVWPMRVDRPEPLHAPPPYGTDVDLKQARKLDCRVALAALDTAQIVAPAHFFAPIGCSDVDEIRRSFIHSSRFLNPIPNQMLQFQRLGPPPKTLVLEILLRDAEVTSRGTGIERGRKVSHGPSPVAGGFRRPDPGSATIHEQNRLGRNIAGPSAFRSFAAPPGAKIRAVFGYGFPMGSRGFSRNFELLSHGRDDIISTNLARPLSLDLPPR